MIRIEAGLFVIFIASFGIGYMLSAIRGQRLTNRTLLRSASLALGCLVMLLFLVFD